MAFEAGGRLWEFNRIPFSVTKDGPIFQEKYMILSMKMNFVIDILTLIMSLLVVMIKIIFLVMPMSF